tara:strand:- start:7754 stop:9703 length:1950 start_codon:yes stop_codon:yes gene_type:complete
MRIKVKKLIRLLITLKDVGLIRISLRLKYELRRIIDKYLPFKLAIYLTKGTQTTPNLNKIPIRNFSKTISWPKQYTNYCNQITFKFINQEEIISEPINWNNTNFSRLWIFNLHYFDWSRKWLDEAIINNKWQESARGLSYLIDNWIDSNTTKEGDGWHSYTTSLRLRNWLLLFQICPNLNSPKRLRSLWHQLCWLRSHPESCHGGNHWLENIISLAIGGLQFEGSYSNEIYNFAIRNLQKELGYQILNDGGHEERSASYHILILDHLIELGCLLEIFKKERPCWLIKHIKEMKGWLDSIRLINGNFPSFNDSAKDSCPSLDTTIAFANSFLTKNPENLNGVRGFLLSTAFNKELTFPAKTKLAIKEEASLTDLPKTGWAILRPGYGWELTFKCGVACPPHLAAHAHSDLLSFDLYNLGEEVIAETGTSTYDLCSKRHYERSIKSHNTLQLGKKNGSSILWIEPIDIWSSFRAGRKANTLRRSCGKNDKWLWVQGSHDGFQSIGGYHFRSISIRLDSSGLPIIVIIDQINTIKNNIMFRSWLHTSKHFSNLQNSSILNSKYFHNSNISKTTLKDKKGYISYGFGKRKTRKVIQMSGENNLGNNILVTVIANPSLNVYCEYKNSISVKVLLEMYGKIELDLTSENPSITHE